MHRDSNPAEILMNQEEVVIRHNYWSRGSFIGSRHEFE